jgi:hypothetical protein
MVSQKTSPRRKDAARLAVEINLGSHSLIFNENEVLQLLRTAVEREGNQVAFARRCGVERTCLNLILNRKRPVGGAVLRALRLRKVYAPE